MGGTKRRVDRRSGESKRRFPAFPRRFVPDRETLRVYWRRTLGILLVAAFGGAVWASLEVRTNVRGDERLHIDTWSLTFATLPSWVTPEIADELHGIDLVHPERRLTVLDIGAVDWIRDRLEASAWVRAVQDVRLVYPTVDVPGTLLVDLWLRRPVAIIPQGGLFHLTDGEGLRVGFPYRDSPREWFGVPAIIGLAETGPLPAQGEPWRNDDLLQGIEVARALLESGILEEFPEHPIDAIDLSNLHGRRAPRESEIVLRRGRQRLSWGRSSLSPSPRTVPLATLLANLRYVLARPDVFDEFAEIHLHRERPLMTGVRG